MCRAAGLYHTDNTILGTEGVASDERPYPRIGTTNPDLDITEQHPLSGSVGGAWEEVYSFDGTPGDWNLLRVGGRYARRPGRRRRLCVDDRDGCIEMVGKLDIEGIDESQVVAVAPGADEQRRRKVNR